jgi:hypothetical protein
MEEVREASWRFLVLREASKERAVFWDFLDLKSFDFGGCDVQSYLYLNERSMDSFLLIFVTKSRKWESLSFIFRMIASIKVSCCLYLFPLKHLP